MRRVHPSRLRFATLLCIAPLLTACATTSAGPPADVTGHTYEFSGRVDGQQVSGTVTFPEGGGYVLSGPTMTCSKISARDVREFDHRRHHSSIRVSCHDRMTVELSVLDGAVEDRGTVYAYETVTSRSPGGCLAEDENGNCIRRATEERSRRVVREGALEVRRVDGRHVGGGVH